MSRRSSFTIITPLPAPVTREIVIDMLHTYTDMIDLNPLVEERHAIKPPPHATAEEYNCWWYSLTDRVQYFPGNIMTTKVSYTVCFHDLANGLQAHYYAPLGLNIKNKWTLCGSLPGEKGTPVEIGVGAPLSGLYLREDIKMTCNFMATPYVKKFLKRCHATLVSRLTARAQFIDVRSTLPCPDYDNANTVQDYEPIEFGRDGQNTVDPISDIQSLFHARTTFTPSKFHQNPRPSSSCGGSPTTQIDSSDASYIKPLVIESSNHTRASSSCSPLAPKSPWNSLNTPILTSVNVDPGNQDAYYELDSNQTSLLKDDTTHLVELDTATVVRRVPVDEKFSNNFSFSQKNTFAPVELEGSIPT